jgi:hypothetical protein
MRTSTEALGSGRCRVSKMTLEHDVVMVAEALAVR